MRNIYYGFSVLAIFLLSHMAVGQEKSSTNSVLAVHEFLVLKSADGRSHAIEAIALGQSGNAEVIYVVEGVHDPLPRGSTGPADGEYMLWKLNPNGKVLSKEFISKMSDFEPPCVTIIPLPAPQEGAIIIGMFDDRFGWSLQRVDAAGKIAKSVKLINEPSAFMAAVLLPDTEGLLLAGQYGFKGNVWKVDLDGNAIWKKNYIYKDHSKDARVKVNGKNAIADDKSSAQFRNIILADEYGGFVVVGDFGKINKLGLGPRSVWLLRCDAEGIVLSETTFSGRIPSICAIGKQQYAILYDASSVMLIDSRVRIVNQQLEKLRELKVQFTAPWVDAPVIAPVASAPDFILAGCNIISDNGKKPGQWECRFYQYNDSDQLISTVSLPVARDTILHPRVASGKDCTYIATQTKGLGPFDAKEAGVFEVDLHNRRR